MTTHDARIQNGQVVLTPQQAAELGVREGDALTVRVQEDSQSPFDRWIGTLPPLPGGETSAQFYRRLRDGD